MKRLDEAIGLARSLLVYHGIPWRHAQLVRFYRTFVPAGGLAFDIGAHVGNRVRAFRRLGARVVAVEPQPACRRVLQRMFRNDAQVILREEALGHAPGEAQLLVSPRTPTVSTLAADWAARVGATPAFRGVRWSESVRVPVTTLDALITAHGRPDFVKIDVEGHEAAVLAGLTQPVPALSFEVLQAEPAAALACVERLEALARHRYRACAGERFRWLQPAAMDADGVRRWIDSWPRGGSGGAAAAGSGDIYAWPVEGVGEHARQLVHGA